MYTITFNESGQITSELPALVTTKDCIEFVVVGTKENYRNRVLDAYQRYLETIKNLDKNTNDLYTVLDNINMDNVTRTNRRLLWDLQAKMATALLDWVAHDPEVANIVMAKRNLSEDKAKLQTFVDRGTSPPSEDMKDMAIPNPVDLAKASYVVDYDFRGAFPSGAKVCAASEPLIGTEDCCSWKFKSKPITIAADIPFYRLGYKLRLRNVTYDVLNAQLKQLNALMVKARAIDLDKEKKNLKAAMDGVKAAGQADAAELFDWMDSKIKGKEDQTSYAHIKTVYDQTAAGDNMFGEINKAIANTYKSSVLDPDILKFMLALSWATKGNNLTLNPLTSGLPTDSKGQIDTKTEELNDSTRSLSALGQKIDLYKAMLNPAGKDCCKPPYYADQLKAFNAMLDLQKVIVKAQDKLTKDIQTLKDQQTKSAKTQSDLKKTMLSDSLFYDGYLNISQYTDKFSHPGYHYMRHHDALNDYRHFDITQQLEINEAQFLEAVAENQDPSKKIVIKYTFASAGSDVDFIGTQTSLALAAAPPHKKLDDIYNAYKRISDLYIPYGNGVINLPLLPMIDQTPNYITKVNVPPDPDKAPQIGSYVFQDSVSAKNLTTQGVAFKFRINKLYNFRFKAGIAYSHLSRRTYSINPATNTATFTTNYVGMGPDFGVQIFTRRIDIQRKDIFPDGAAPFFYVGYLYNDAPINNFLLGGGWEIVSGFAIMGGVHLGKSQSLFTGQGVLQTKDTYKGDWFVSLSFGLEAFKNVFNTAKSIANPSSK
ncbi:hypothetical protein BEL04_08515 [Mucilaginibacter sp. PPCGB 2223]|nr:hypothetical protein BEL04_08515 [Mucilaginibacter sp. PPCGB 2223]